MSDARREQRASEAFAQGKQAEKNPRAEKNPQPASATLPGACPSARAALPADRLRVLRWGLGVLLALCVVVFSAVTVYVLGRSDSTIEGVSGAFMEQMSSQIRLNFDSEVRLYRSELESVVLSTLSHELRADEDLRGTFVEEARTRGFVYAAAIDLDDGARDVLFGDDLEIDDLEGFGRAVRAGEDRVTSGVTAAGETVILLGEAVERPMPGSGTSELLVVGVPIESVVTALSLDVSTTQVYSHIVRADGSFVLNSGANTAPNYLDLLRQNENQPGVRYDVSADELSGVMAEGGTDFYVVYVNGSRYASYLAPLPETTWFIVSVLPYSVLRDPINSLVGNLVAAALVGCVLVLLALVYVFVRYLRLLRAQMDELALAREAADAAREAADAASRAKSEFLSNMSHDIRTPMNAIVGMTRIARERTDDAEAVSDCLDKISASSAHLLNLINDVLDMSRIESGRMELVEERASLTEVVDAVAAIVEPQAAARGLRFTVDASGVTCRSVLTDRTRLSQVLLNLLSNAVKFTPAGGSVSLSVKQAESPVDAARVQTEFWVEDTGIGMSEEFLGRIFDSFEREDSERVRKTEGTGLGMAIVKRIVDGMGGSIEVRSEKNVGSCFHVTLDLARAAGCEEDATEADPDALVGARVLLAEDNELNWEVASELLGACGLELDWAQDGAECVERFRASEPGHYDAILMDVRMPRMNGYEATRAIRALDRPDAVTVPIVAMTADAFAEDRERARACGMSGHVSKPIDLREVLRTLARLVRAVESPDSQATAPGTPDGSHATASGTPRNNEEASR